jgi:CheY-like chemotaxis protein
MGRPRILVIDDETKFREAIAQALGLDGYDVETARDGSEGATLVCRHPYDLIFCDLRMPEVDGRGSTRRSSCSVPTCVVARMVGPKIQRRAEPASVFPWENDRHAH